MKYSPGFLSRCGALAGAALLAVGSLHAQSFNLTFDASQLGNANYNNDNLWVTFQGQELAATLGSESVTMTSGLSGTGNMMSKSYSFTDIAAAGGFNITNASSIIAFISYGSNVGFNNGTSAPSPTATATRYTEVEFSYTGTSTAAADLTNINYFGGGLRMDAYSGSNGTTLQSSRYYNASTSGEIFRTLAATTTTGTASNAVFSTTGTAYSGQTQWARVVAPDTYGSGAPYPVTTMFPSLKPYVDSVAATSGGTVNIASLGLIEPGGSPTESPAQAYTKLTGGDNYDLHYDFETTISVVSGTYTIVMSGSVTANLTAGQTPDGQNPAQLTYDDMTITIVIGDEGSLNGWLYGQPNPPGTVPTSAIVQDGVSYVTSGAGWAALNTDFGTAAQNFYERIPNDLTEGFLVGAVGSDQPSGIGGLTIGQLNSAQWWANPNLTYEAAQPDSPYYNVYAAALWKATGGANPDENGIPQDFTTGAVYINPFDDRYGGADLTLYGIYTGQPQDPTTLLNITLIPDGDMDINAVPEPGTWALIIGGLVLLLGRQMVKRRRTA